MALISDQSNFFNFTQFITWKGQYSGSQGTQDFEGNFVTDTYIPTSSVVDFNPPTGLTRGFNTYYKMQGYNTNTSRYEVWFSTNAPLLIPPSGHTLSNIEIVLTWIDR